MILIVPKNILSNDEIKIISPEKFEVLKNSKVTQIFLLDQDKKYKKEIFNKFIRDEIQWIYSEDKNKDQFLIITRPMVAGPEHSRFWFNQNGNLKMIGQTNCLNHQIDNVNLKEISYRCFKDDPKNPLELIEEKITFKIK